MRHEWASVVWTRAKVCKHCGAKRKGAPGAFVYALATSNEWSSKSPKCKQ